MFLLSLISHSAVCIVNKDKKKESKLQAIHSIVIKWLSTTFGSSKYEIVLGFLHIVDERVQTNTAPGEINSYIIYSEEKDAGPVCELIDPNAFKERVDCTTVLR